MTGGRKKITLKSKNVVAATVVPIVVRYETKRKGKAKSNGGSSGSGGSGGDASAGGGGDASGGKEGTNERTKEKPSI